MIAVALDPIHGDYGCKCLRIIPISDPPECLLWEALAEGEFRNDHGTKGGSSCLTTVKQIPLPKMSLVQRIAFSILCAREVRPLGKEWEWARDWLSGEKRDPVLAGREAQTEIQKIEAWGRTQPEGTSFSTASAQAADTAMRSYFYTAALTVSSAARHKDLDLVSLVEEAMKVPE
ncbi:MAG: hypothetical protein WC824_14670 [Bacteroidota bacterium]